MNPIRPALLLASILLASGCAMRCYKPYDAVRGDSVGGVCRKFGLSEAEVRRYNRIDPGYELREGDRIFIPCEAVERPAAKRLEPETASHRTDNAQAPAVLPAPAPSAKPPAVAMAIPEGEGRHVPKQGETAFRWPVDGELLRGFGQGADTAPGGVDIKSAAGLPVVAAQAGRVEYAGTPANAYGPMILLAHADGVYTVYSRLGGLAASTGDRVSKGQKIGSAGGEGFVHFEVREGRKPVDPLLYLPRR